MKCNFSKNVSISSLEMEVEDCEVPQVQGLKIVDP